MGMRARWRRLAGLALCASCLPLVLRLLLLGREVVGPPPPAALAATGPDEAPADREPGARRGRAYAGAYMAGRTAGNASYCRWQYGLPARLDYVEQQVISSPGATGPGGRHRVLPFVARGEADSLPAVTLCSHATADQVYAVVELARRWEGPLAIAVFAPGRDARIAVSLLDRACHCEPAMARVSVHLIFPRDRPMSLGSTNPFKPLRADCSAIDLQYLSRNATERWHAGLSYPINVARNVARALAATQRVLVSDVELLPSERLASRFVAMLKGRAPRRAVAFVLPVFEVEAGEPPPSNKQELLAALRTGVAVYFHRFSCSHCQRFPGLTRWILRPDPGRVRPLIITKREYPHNRWEPIFIGTKNDPLYTEEMTWEGRQDKMTQMFEMCLLNYRLIVLDGAFLVHTPGIKRKPDEPLQGRASERQRAHERQNARIYQRVTRRLLAQYPGNRRCRP